MKPVLKANPYELSATLNALWKPPYQRSVEEGEEIAQLFAHKEVETDRAFSAENLAPQISDEVDVIERVWLSHVAPCEPDLRLTIYHSAAPCFMHGPAWLTPDLQPLHLEFTAGEGLGNKKRYDHAFQRLLAAADPVQRERLQRRLLVSDSDYNRVLGFTTDFDAQKSSEDRLTDIDANRWVEIEHLALECRLCIRFLDLLGKADVARPWYIAPAPPGPLDVAIAACRSKFLTPLPKN